MAPPSSSSSQLALSALQRRIALRVAPGSLRRLIRRAFPRIYAELLEQNSPKGLVDDLFQIAANHGETDAVIATLYAEWQGLRSDPHAWAPIPALTRRSPRVLSLLLLLGPMQDIGPTREDLAVSAPSSHPDSPLARRPETVLPTLLPLPSPVVTHSPPKPPRPQPPVALTSLTQLQSVLRDAMAPCAHAVGGGLYFSIVVGSDEQGKWSRTAVNDFSRDLHRCIVQAIDRARARRNDRFPRNTEARLVVTFPEESA